ncbi:MAG: family 20 glycosylhydrolase [Clostridia bacterium]|nr:family 20 glycosylhydrolase [Clostridia bacterium]
MIKLMPQVKSLNIKDGFLANKSLNISNLNCDIRLIEALSFFNCSVDGSPVIIETVDMGKEEYELIINTDSISIRARDSAGAFYAIQTLRQIFREENVPCLHIYDKPDFEYRGYYHDVTRGKIPTVSTLKKLIDNLAYYKINSLQLYVEHTFELEEYKNIIEYTGYITKEEMRELDAYCKKNFIDFIPSLSTFGHLYELLQQDKYKHLCILKDYHPDSNFWYERMMHHTINPLLDESVKLITGMIDRYSDNFDSDIFNICCDETFDLKKLDDGQNDVGMIHIDFVNKLIKHVNSLGKKAMLWADSLLLNDPDVIKNMPKDTYFLSWCYDEHPDADPIVKFGKMGVKQIVCPGTSSWSRLCENVIVEENNITNMINLGRENKAIGVLNTNWGDWGNPCSIELAMYGTVLGAAKSWDASTEINDEFYDAVNSILYENDNGFQILKELSILHEKMNWFHFCSNYIEYRYDSKFYYNRSVIGNINAIQNEYLSIKQKLEDVKWINDEYRQEMLIAAEGVCVMGELSAKMFNQDIVRITDTKEWLDKYRRKWKEKNKKDEFYRIEDMFIYLEEN